MSSQVAEVLRAAVGELREMAKSETVIGEPIQAGDRTVIPVVKISLGFGAGGGGGSKNQSESGFGGGGGGGARIEPAGFIILDKDGVSLLPMKKGSWESMVDAIPGAAKKIAKFVDGLKTARSEMKSDDKSNGDSSDSPHGEHAD